MIPTNLYLHAFAYSSNTIPRKEDHHLIVLLSAQLKFLLAYSLSYHAVCMLNITLKLV